MFLYVSKEYNHFCEVLLNTKIKVRIKYKKIDSCLTNVPRDLYIFLLKIFLFFYTMPL